MDTSAKKRARSASPDRSVRIKAIANAARMEEKRKLDRAKAAAKQREKRKKSKEEESKKVNEKIKMWQRMTPDERMKQHLKNLGYGSSDSNF